MSAESGVKSKSMSASMISSLMGSELDLKAYEFHTDEDDEKEDDKDVQTE